MITTTTTAEDADVSPGGRVGLEEEVRAAVVPNGDALHAKAEADAARPDGKYAEASRTPARTCAPPAPTHFVLDGHLRAPPCRRPDRAPGPRTPSPRGVRQQPGGGASQDKRAWV